MSNNCLTFCYRLLKISTTFLGGGDIHFWATKTHDFSGLHQNLIIKCLSIMKFEFFMQCFRRNVEFVVLIKNHA